MKNAVEKLASACIDQKSIVSFVGGGGKTTAIFLLADHLQKQNVDVAVTTTTHFHIPPFYKNNFPVYGTPADNKLAPPDNIEEILGKHQVVLIEADGAKGKPLKAPADHEPVLHPATTHLVITAGLSAVGKQIADAGFRTEQLCQILNCIEEHIITPDDVAKVLLSSTGGRKSAGDLPCTLLLNQADTKELYDQGAEIALAAQAEGIPTVIAALQRKELP